MAVTIDATVGGASANSYVTLATANTYFEGRLNVTDWTGATDDNKNRALVSAARRLDQESYEGIRASSTQALQWPRDGLYDEDGNSIDEDTIPQRVQDAQCELALYMLGEDLLEDTGLEGFDAVKVGPIDVEVNHGKRAGDLPENVRRELSWWLTTSRSTVRVVRG